MSLPFKMNKLFISYKDAKPLIFKYPLHCQDGAFILPDHTMNTALAWVYKGNAPNGLPNHPDPHPIL